MGLISWKSMLDLTSSIKHFAFLNRAPGATWSEATKVHQTQGPAQEHNYEG